MPWSPQSPNCVSQPCSYVVDPSVGDSIFLAPTPGQHVILTLCFHIYIFFASAPVVLDVILTHLMVSILLIGRYLYSRWVIGHAP